MMIKILLNVYEMIQEVRLLYGIEIWGLEEGWRAFLFFIHLFTTCDWAGTRWQESFKHITFARTEKQFLKSQGREHVVATLCFRRLFLPLNSATRIL